jgi:hypothetical protein
MPWFGVRSLYHFGVKPDGRNIFEERVVCFEGSSFDEAQDKAHLECETYAKDHGFTWFPKTVAYEQDGDKLIQGYEVWSELYESNETLDSFWRSRYSRFEYHPYLPAAKE